MKQFDPRYLLARDTGFADHDLAVTGGRHAVIVELLAQAKGDARNRAIDALNQALGATGGIPDAFKRAPEDLRVVTALVNEKGLDVLADETGRLFRRFEYAQALKTPRLRPVTGLKPPTTPARRMESREASAGKESTREAKNLFVVIDHGCPFMHPLLMRADGSTRVRALWDQQPGAKGRGPKGFGYGTLLTREQLDAAIRAAEGSEDHAYQALGYEVLRRRVSHGAHVLGMLLDDRLERRRPGASRPEGDVLFVQLPQALLGAPSRAVLSRCLIDALVWVQAQRQSNERVVLALSEGTSQGPHDGSSMVEQVLNAFTQWRPPEGAANIVNQVYVAAGNGLDERLHAQPSLPARQARVLTWRLPPANELPSTMELWVPDLHHDPHDGLSVTVTAPDGSRIGPLLSNGTVHWPQDGVPLVSLVSSAWKGRGCTLTLLRIAPTGGFAGNPRAQCGDWQVELKSGRGFGQARIHAYIGRIKQALGFPLRTSQSTFVGSQGERAGGPAKEGTVQGLATAVGVVAAGALVGRATEKHSAPYSAIGPTRDRRHELKVRDVRADDGPVLQGRRSIGNRGGVTFRMNGTSVAAPLAARLDVLSKAVAHKKEDPGAGKTEDPFDC